MSTSGVQAQPDKGLPVVVGGEPEVAVARRETEVARSQWQATVAAPWAEGGGAGVGGCAGP